MESMNVIAVMFFGHESGCTGYIPATSWAALVAGFRYTWFFVPRLSANLLGAFSACDSTRLLWCRRWERSCLITCGMHWHHIQSNLLFGGLTALHEWFVYRIRIATAILACSSDRAALAHTCFRDSTHNPVALLPARMMQWT